MYPRWAFEPETTRVRFRGFATQVVRAKHDLPRRIVDPPKGGTFCSWGYDCPATEVSTPRIKVDAVPLSIPPPHCPLLPDSTFSCNKVKTRARGPARVYSLCLLGYLRTKT